MDADEAIPDGYFQTPADWSHDGRFIAFGNTTFSQIDNEVKGDIWLVDMARDRKVIHLINTPFHESNPTFSPDGRWLAFTSNESGQTELYVQAFEPGESPRLVENAISSPGKERAASMGEQWQGIVLPRWGWPVICGPDHAVSEAENRRAGSPVLHQHGSQSGVALFGWV